MADIESTGQSVTKKYHRFVRIFYQIRATAFAVLFVAIGMQMWGRGYGGLAWALLALQFLAYPHLLFWRARRAPDSLKAEHANLLLDCLLLGIWITTGLTGGWGGPLGALPRFVFGAVAWGSSPGSRFRRRPIPLPLHCA